MQNENVQGVNHAEINDFFADIPTLEVLMNEASADLAGALCDCQDMLEAIGEGKRRLMKVLADRLGKPAEIVEHELVSEYDGSAFKIKPGGNDDP